MVPNNNKDSASSNSKMALQSVSQNKQKPTVKAPPPGSKKRKLSFQKQVQLQELKEELLEMKINDAMAKEILFKSKAEKFYKEMREQSLKKINQSGDGRFEVMFKNELQPFQEEVKKEYKALLDYANKINNKKLKQKIMNLLAQMDQGQEEFTQEELE